MSLFLDARIESAETFYKSFTIFCTGLTTRFRFPGRVTVDSESRLEVTLLRIDARPLGRSQRRLVMKHLMRWTAAAAILLLALQPVGSADQVSLDVAMVRPTSWQTAIL